MTRITIHYGSAVTVFPSIPQGVLERATKTDLLVLLALCARPADGGEADLRAISESLAAAAGCAVAQAEASLAFWRGTGLIDIIEGEHTARTLPAITAPAAPSAPTEHPAAAAAPAAKKPSRRDELPQYTSEELATLLEEHEDVASYINECQRTWGKIFNTHEVNILLGLVDYLGLEWEYVISLLAYCVQAQEKRGGKKSMRYVESTAFSFYDEGINDPVALQEKLRQLEQMADIEGQLRALFGMGARAWTPKEKQCFSTWLYEYHYGMEIIRMAYDVTVDTKGAPNLNYMNSVLANWNKDNLRTPADVEANQAAFRAERGKGKAGTVSGSFDTDDFFEAAVRQSLGDEFADAQRK